MDDVAWRISRQLQVGAGDGAIVPQGLWKATGSDKFAGVVVQHSSTSFGLCPKKATGVPLASFLPRPVGQAVETGGRSAAPKSPGGASGGQETASVRFAPFFVAAGVRPA
jgi:hypothetical protein